MSIRQVLEEVLVGLDDDALEYFEGMIGEGMDDESIRDTLSPFIESYGLASDDEGLSILISRLCSRLREIGVKEQDIDKGPCLLGTSINLGEKSKSMISETEQVAIDTMWGFDKIRQKKNDTIELTEAGSAKYERKAVKDQKKWLEDLESKFVGEDEDDNQISAMTLPTLDGNSNEKDIHVHNFNVTFGGKVLLEGADLRLVYGRRYGLVGRNGIGESLSLPS